MTNYVPNFKTLVVSQAASLQRKLENSLPCYDVAKSIFLIEDSVCGAGLYFFAFDH